jgi:hypothetical protein
MSHIADQDGLGAFHFQWESSADGKSWSEVAGANSETFETPVEAAAAEYRVVATYTDGAGFHDKIVGSPVLSSDWVI